MQSRNMTFHIGLIGGGNITETHARAARAIPGVEISAIHGTNAEKITAGNTVALPIKISKPSSIIAPWIS